MLSCAIINAMQELLKKVQYPQDVKNLDNADLPLLAQALRNEIMEVVSRKGGHLASNLGVVELTVALLRVFSPPADKIVFDVSHQVYAYKLLTGRAERFDSLRQIDGLSGFMKRSESEFDAYGAGHAGTALSAALGFAAARDRLGGDEHVVAVIGDASMSNGGSFEALNNVQGTTGKLIVILNDNEMGISHNVGSLARHLGRLLASPRYNRMKLSVERTGIKRLRMHWFRKHYQRIQLAIKSLLVHSAIFEEFGLRYIGPIDGHNMLILQNALEIAKNSASPILVHVATRKGCGYRFAEEHPVTWHGAPPFEVKSGERQAESKTPSYSQVFGETLLHLAEEDDRIAAITAAMTEGTGLAGFRERLPGRFFDVGICELHQAVFAAGLAAAGMKPVVAVYSTFLQRSVDAVLHDVALQGLPVVFCLDRSGIVSSDGATHHGIYDLAWLRTIPGLIIMQPRNEPELVQMLCTALQSGKPCVIRYPRGAGTGEPYDMGLEALVPGEAEIIRPMQPPGGSSGTFRKVAVWALGDMLSLATEVADLLSGQGIAAGVVNARFVKPLDTRLLERQVGEGCELFATFENAVANGGFGSLVQESLASGGFDVPVHITGWPDEFVQHAGTADELFERHGLTAQKIAERIVKRMQGL